MVGDGGDGRPMRDFDGALARELHGDKRKLVRALIWTEEVGGEPSTVVAMAGSGELYVLMCRGSKPRN